MLPFTSLVSSEQLTVNVINKIIDTSDVMATISSGRGRTDILSDKLIALLFFEPSSRTMLSFQSASQKLKAGILFAQGSDSTSFKKGESIEDMIKVTSSYSDLIVMRHALPKSAKRAASVSEVPFINAGDGSNEHPTQALTDLYTIKKELGQLNDLKVTFGFDPLQSRSIHSLAKALSLFPNNEFTFVSPPELRPPDDFLDFLRKSGCLCKIVDNLEDALNVDLLYLNRLQEERFEDPNLFMQYRKDYSLTKSMVVNQQFIVMDPLPRIDEISVEVDSLNNAAYFRQAGYGVPVRMALLATMLNQV